MEEEGPVNVKALRAKFQEETLNSQSKTSRPVVAEKPKLLPPPVAENKTPRILSRDGLRASGGKRPNSFPPHSQKSPTSFQGDDASKKTLKHQHLALVLPVRPLKENKTDRKQEAEPARDVLPSTKIKKKTLLLPFKSTKASKVYADEPTYADLTTRPSSAPCELPSLEQSITEDDAYQSSRDCPLSSPDVPHTPPSADTSADSDNKFFSTLERAKKKFSRRNMLMATKSKNVRSPDFMSSVRGFPSPPPSIRELDLPTPPPPVCLPHLACISARPFFKTDKSARKLDKSCGWSKPGPPSMERSAAPLPPAKKSFPDLSTLGQVPVKPPRPPTVDLSRFHPPKDKEQSPCQVPPEEPEPVHPSISSSALVPPEFPDFECSEPETTEGGRIDIAGLELEALDFVSLTRPAPNDLSDFEDQQSDFCDSVEPAASSTIKDLNLGSPNIVPLDPSSIPEPANPLEFPEATKMSERSHSKDTVTLPPVNTDETGPSSVDCYSSQEEAELSSHAAINEENQSYSHSQQGDYYEACDNVYEDVENINKYLRSQHLLKLKSVKNPYADNTPLKADASLNVWPRNPWAPVAGDHIHKSHNHSKEHQSPNTADYKENKKKEKQRLEREKKEQKEREKKENEMKKKFKVTGEEEPMYHAKVMVANKVRKNDLPVKSGDTVSIIRTTNCPKGKWLARDATHKYGYISVMNVELNIKEMLELSKKAQAAGRGGNTDGDTISIGSRSSSHPVLTSSFTDDSEEWACEDETLSASNDSHRFPQHSSSMPEMSCGGHVGAQHALNDDANLEDLYTQTRHEALQKLAIFFQHGKNDFDDGLDGEGATPTNVDPPNLLSAVEEPPYPDQEVDFTELELLPPPPLYADAF